MSIEETGFVLVGHDCPLGGYPSIVVPVGRLGEDLAILYSKAESYEIVPISGSSKYIAHSNETARALAEFDHRLHGLFAFNEQSVVLYSIGKEDQFFDHLLRSPIWGGIEPFYRFSLAKASGQLDLIEQAFHECRRQIHLDSPEFEEPWLQANDIGGWDLHQPERMRSKGESGTRAVRRSSKENHETSKCAHHHSLYFYQASAYGLAAEIERPVRQSIPTQAAVVLSDAGGTGSSGQVVNFSVPPFVSFKAAHSEVGGSFDDCHNIHTTYAQATIERLNIFDMVTADRVVARLTIYSPMDGDPEGENSFSITGSHFENLRVAGHLIDLRLATDTLHQLDTYSKIEKTYRAGKEADLLPWGNQNEKRLDELEKLEEQYHPLMGIGRRAKAWKHKNAQRRGGAYWCSAAGHLNLHDQVKGTELQGFGGILLIPKFGILRLAELIIQPDHRHLTMFHVEMSSPSFGSCNGGGVSGGGTLPFP